MVKLLAEKYNGIACEENYHDALISDLDSNEFPGLTYTRDLKDWREFIRRTPDEYEAWIKETTKECTILELQILDELSKQDKMICVDTNIPTEVLAKISDRDHVLIMLAEPEISVKCLKRVNSKEIYNHFLNSGFNVILRDDERTIEETLALVEKSLKMK